MSYNPSNRPSPYAVPSLPPGYQPPLQQKKGRVGGWIIAIVILLLIGGGIYAYYAFQARPTPEKTLNAFCNAWKTGNRQEMSDQLTPSAQKQFQVFETILKVPPKDCTVSNVQENGSTATGTITVTSNVYGRTLSRSASANLDQEQGAWKITGFNAGQMSLS